MEIIELLIDEENVEQSGVEAISVVSQGAIESDFIALKSHEIKFAEVDKEQRILMGAVLIPNKPIYRKSGDKEYYVYFSANTIKKASELYLMNGYQDQATLEHKEKISDLTLVESWIVDDPEMDKSKKYGLEGINKGTWMASMKVNNDDIWNNYVKEGLVRGFSIEGYFIDKAERPKESIKDNMSKDQIAEDQLKDIMNILEMDELQTKLAKHKMDLNYFRPVQNKLDQTASQENKINQLGRKHLAGIIQDLENLKNQYKVSIALYDDRLDKVKNLDDGLAQDLDKKYDGLKNQAKMSIKVIDRHIAELKQCINMLK